QSGTPFGVCCRATAMAVGRCSPLVVLHSEVVQHLRERQRHHEDRLKKLFAAITEDPSQATPVLKIIWPTLPKPLPGWKPPGRAMEPLTKAIVTASVAGVRQASSALGYRTFFTGLSAYPYAALEFDAPRVDVPDFAPLVCICLDDVI